MNECMNTAWDKMVGIAIDNAFESKKSMKLKAKSDDEKADLKDEMRSNMNELKEMFLEQFSAHAMKVRDGSLRGHKWSKNML